MFSVMDMSHISLPTHVCKDTVIREKFVLKFFEHQNQTQKTGYVCLCMVMYMCRESEINQP